MLNHGDEGRVINRLVEEVHNLYFTSVFWLIDKNFEINKTETHNLCMNLYETVESTVEAATLLG